MKNILKKVLSVAAATALLMTSVISASAVDHNHKDGTSLNDGSETTKNPGDYTITLTYPEVNGKKYTFSADNSHYGAYQIFSGKVKGEKYTEDGLGANPGTNSVAIPITDIKWGSAFGVSGDVNTNKNILEFVYALYEAPSNNDYGYAFKDFTGFDGFFDVTGNLNSKYVTDTSTIQVDLDSVSGDVSKVNFDKLALDVADVLTKQTDHEWLQAFTDILGGYAGKELSDPTTESYHNKAYAKQYYEGSVSSDSYSYNIYVPAGYYMVRDLSSINDESEADYSHAYSARMLFVTNDIAQVLKVDVPTLDKEILRDNAAVGSAGNKTDVAGVGDVVHFQLKGTLPDNYDEFLGGYQYSFIDTLSDGLDLVKYGDTHSDYVTSAANANDCVKVTVKGLYMWDTSKIPEAGWVWKSDATATIPVDVYTHTASVGSNPSDVHLTGDVNNYTATYSSKTLTVKFPCLKEIRIVGDGTGNTVSDNVYCLGYDAEDAGSTINSSKIYVDYYAKVNEQAIVYPKEADAYNGNYNEAQIEYSDNPQAYADTDKTVINRATVYTLGLDITKVNAAEFIKNDGNVDADDVKLSDARFVLVREKPGTPGSYQIAKFYGMAADGEGTIKTAYSSIDTWEDVVIDTDETLVSTVRKKDGTYMTDNSYHVDSDANGKIIISGLNDETKYTLIEIKTPDNDLYAFIDPIDFSLTAYKASDEYDGKIDSVTETTGFSGDDSLSMTKYVINETEVPDKTGVADFTVANFKYTDLPSTGGIGVYIYYIAGGCVVALAVVLFALSKKKKTTK